MASFGLPPQKTSVVHVLIFAACLLSIMWFVPFTIGLSKGGFSIEGIKTQYVIYLQSGIAGLGIVVLLYVIEKMIRRGDLIYGDGQGFYSPGQEPHLRTRIFDNPWRLALACIIIFSILGLIANATQQTFTGVGSLQQQFTRFDNAVFSGALVAASENLGAAAVLALFIFCVRLYARKAHLSKVNFKIITWTGGILIVGIYGLVNHLSRYGNQDVALLTVFFFWAMGALMTMVSGSFIPFWVAHILNNVFYDLGKAFSSDSTVSYVIGFIVAATALYLYLYVFRRGRKEE